MFLLFICVLTIVSGFVCYRSGVQSMGGKFMPKALRRKVPDYAFIEAADREIFGIEAQQQDEILSELPGYHWKVEYDNSNDVKIELFNKRERVNYTWVFTSGYTYNEEKLRTMVESKMKRLVDEELQKTNVQKVLDSIVSTYNNRPVRKELK